MSQQSTKTSWYIRGLNFNCKQCSRCCSGPEEGYIWVSKQEIKLIADFLNISVQQMQNKYLKHVSFRTTIIERPLTKDCIFLEKKNNRKICMIYPCRPNQCRTWPFWDSNLASLESWNAAALKCDGINHGKHYSFEEIEKIRTSRQWWTDEQ